jgi:hypothetical protein
MTILYIQNSTTLYKSLLFSYFEAIIREPSAA